METSASTTSARLAWTTSAVGTLPRDPPGQRRGNGHLPSVGRFGGGSYPHMAMKG